MTRKFLLTPVLLLLFVLAASACSGLIPSTGDNPQSQIATQNAYILQSAESTATQMALENQIAQLQTQIAALTQSPGQPPQVVTATPQPQDPGAQQPTSTALDPTSTPTATPVPPTATATPIPPTAAATAVPPTTTATAVPPTALPTATAIPCNAAEFVQDVTVPDRTVYAPGTNFTKTWRLKNTGACTWTTNYDLVFVSGDAMGTTSVVDFTSSVAPNQVIDLSVPLTAPARDSSYRSYWKIRDAGGVLFGVGRTSASFYADIKVVSPVSKYPLDFVASYCLAEWTSGAGKLACPSPENDSRGFILRTENPTLENGYVDDEPALVTYPQMINDGVIRGKYPVYKVQTGDHFSAIIGCGRGAKSCDVNIQLDYQIGDNSIQTLKTWHEVYDEKYNMVDVDLNSLVGKDVKFILTVFANGGSTDDRAVWLAPRIDR